MDPVSVSAVVHLSEAAFSRFCQEQGGNLLQDVAYLQALNHLEAFVSAKRDASTLPVGSMQRINYSVALSTWKQAQIEKVAVQADWFYDIYNQLAVVYDTDQQRLFYFYLLGERNPDDMQATPSVQVLLAQLANYKDIPLTDYILFSSSGTHLRTDPLWRAFCLTPGNCCEIEVERIASTEIAQQADLADTHFFTLLETLEKNTETVMSDGAFNVLAAEQLLDPRLRPYIPSRLDLTLDCPL